MKLLYLDLKTICSQLLNYSKEDYKVIDCEFTESTKSNLVTVFGKINRVIQQQLQIRKKDRITIHEFTDELGIFAIQDFMVKKLSYHNKQQDPSPSNRRSAHHGTEPNISIKKSATHLQSTTALHFSNLEDSKSSDLNSKYMQDEKKLILYLLRKFALADSRSVPIMDMRLSLKFMKEKFKNNIKVENVSRLVAFEKDTLEKASEFMNPSEEEELMENLKEMKETIGSIDSKMERVLDIIRTTKILINK